MNQQQLERTQFSSLYATQVMQNLDGIWQVDYEVDQFSQPLTRQQIATFLENNLDGCAYIDP